MGEMFCYVGCKIIRATQMSECEFLSAYKNEDVSGREDQPGYMVEYPDGYKSWSPKETFEIAYREVTESEKNLLK